MSSSLRHSLTKKIAVGLLESLIDEGYITQEEAYENFEKKGVKRKGRSLHYHWRKLLENKFVIVAPNLLDMRRKYFRITEVGKEWLKSNRT